MNKKFSTLATAGLLLSGALFCNVNAKDYNAAEFKALIKSDVLTLDENEKDLVINLTSDVALDNKFVVIKQKDLVLSANKGVSLTGRLVVAAEGITVEGLKLVNAPVDGTGYWTKNGITVFADAVSIKNNIIAQGSRQSENIVANGIVVFPQTGKVNYNISGNTVTANYTTLADGKVQWGSTGVLIAESTTISKKDGDPLWSGDNAEYASTVPAISGSFNAQAIAEDNTYLDCFTDFLYEGTTLTKSVSANSLGYKYGQVTYDKTLDNKDAIVDLVASSVIGSSAVVRGATLQEVAKILSDAKSGNNAIASSSVALECDDAILLMGDAEVPAGVDKPAIKLDATNLYYSPVADATKLSFGQYYVLGANSTLGQAVKYQEVASGINAKVANYSKINSDFFWTFEKVETGAAVGYAKVKNYNGKYLTDASGNFLVFKLAKTGDNWAPVKDLNKLEFVSVSNLSGSATSIDSKNAFTLGVIGTHALTASELNTIYGESFEAEILYDKKPLNGNPFTGILKTVRLNGAKAEVIKTATDSYMLMNDKDSIIVMLKNDKYAEGKGVYGYKVVQMAPKDLALALASVNAANYLAYFSINAYDNFAVGQDQAVASISVKNDPLDNASYYLGVLKVDGELTLAGRYYTSDELLDPTIKLGKFNKIDVAKLLSKPTFFTVTNINKKGYSSNYGKVLGINADNQAAYIKADEALVNYPETQWAVTYNEATGDLTFKNREYPNAPESYSRVNGSFVPQYFTYNASSIYNTKDSYVFAINGDTVKIAPVAEFTPADGFERLDADKLRDQLFYVGVQSSVWDGVAYAVENHKGNHQIGLDTKKENATEWHLAAARYKEYNALNEVILNRPDTIQVGSTLGYYKADGKYYTTDVKEDGVIKQTVFLKLLSYSLMNQANNEYVRYNDATDVTRYTTGKKDNTGNLTDPQYFALKIVGQNADGKNLYNLVEVNKSIFDEGVEGSFSWNYKVYAGDSHTKGILNRTGLYSQTENDLFVVEEKDAPEYVKLNQGDTIKIFRAETESDVLYQKGEFLGMGNAIEFNNINPALYVDTVYYNRDANNRWEYLLGINVTRIDTTYKCNVPSHGIHQADTTYGAFLVNYADSAIVEDTRDIHTNKYVYDNGFRYAKLGFEEGFRTNDTLYVARADGKFDEIEVGAPSRQLVKFAFRVMDHDANTFIIETGYKYPQDVDHSEEPATGFIRWINGNVVVTPNMEDAEVFKLKADDRDPVANEDLTASSVAVIAGEGQITVNGAAGKVVTITNVLGQTILNSVISSDNATIAAPAGIVIVSVEGEAAVKAIVK